MSKEDADVKKEKKNEKIYSENEFVNNKFANLNELEKTLDLKIRLIL